MNQLIEIGNQLAEELTGFASGMPMTTTLIDRWRELVNLETCQHEQHNRPGLDGFPMAGAIRERGNG
jgi:hypothetical protein